MSAFTTPLKNAIKMLGGEAKIVSGEMVVTGDIGLSHYPIFDEAYRAKLNGKIVRHYWNSEIGMETPDLFKFELESAMGEYMPYFNQLYLSEKKTFDPFSTVDLRTFTTVERDQDTATAADSESDTVTTSQSRAVTSTTPQTQLARNKDYASSGADSSGKTEAKGSGTESATVNMNEVGETESTTTGYQGLTSDMLLRYRETFLNIDLSVIESVAECFMLIVNTGSRYSDRYTHERYTL